MDIKEYVNIADHTTFKIGGQFRYFVQLTDPLLLPKAYEFAKENNLPIFILGGGSNLVFSDGIFVGLVVKIEFQGFEVIADTQSHTDIKIGAGEIWDSVVERTVAMNARGIEAMSAIPGTTGATPVQNVGAYGQEIKDTLVSVDVFDTETKDFRTLSNSECGFSYRTSIFKGDAKGKYVIISLTLRLLKDSPTLPDYPGVKKYFLENNITDVSLVSIRKAIIAIRGIKLPNPKLIANVGSFFKNPIVAKEQAEKLKSKYLDLTIFPVGTDKAKVPAGFLIEACGFKGKNFGVVSVYPHNALVLVNNGGATRADVEKVKNEIIKTVFEKFNIALEPEPEFI